MYTKTNWKYCIYVKHLNVQVVPSNSELKKISVLTKDFCVYITMKY